MRGDMLSLESDRHDGEALIVPVMRGGKRVAPAPTLAQIRERAERELRDCRSRCGGLKPVPPIRWKFLRSSRRWRRKWTQRPSAGKEAERA